MLQRYIQVLMNGGKIVEAPRPLEDGLAAFSAGDYATAEGLLLAAIAEKPDEPRALMALGLIALGDGRHDVAADFLAKARKRMPSDVRLAIALADCQRAVGQLDKAIDGYKAALRLDAQNAMAQRKLGEALYEAGRVSEAVAALNQAVYKDRKDTAARLLIARISLDQQDAQRALAQCHMIEKLVPGQVDVHKLMVDAYERVGDYRQMALELEIVHALGGGDLMTYWRLANAYLMFGRGEDALLSFQQCAMREASPGPAHVAVAQVAEDLGRFNKALEVWRLLSGEKEYQGDANFAIERLVDKLASVAKALTGELRGGTGGLRVA